MKANASASVMSPTKERVSLPAITDVGLELLKANSIDVQLKENWIT
jgi:hypothetical protein